MAQAECGEDKVVKIGIEYEGDLHCKAWHGPSGAEMSTDAPVDNHGRGESFSPTDLVATALGACMVTTMGIVAGNLDVDIAGATATVVKEMSSTAPRKIAALTVRIHMPKALAPEERQKLENAANACPVARSLHPDVRIPVEFVWG